MSLAPISAATDTTSLTAPEFSAFSRRLLNMDDLSMPIDSASAVTSTTSVKLEVRSARNSFSFFSGVLFLRNLCAPLLLEIGSAFLLTYISPAASIASTATIALSSAASVINPPSTKAPFVADPLLSAPDDLAALPGSASFFCSC